MAFEEIEKLKERLAKDPSSKLFVPLAEEYRKAGMFDEAIEVLKKGLESQPSYMSARVSLGKIYLEKDMIEEAKAEFEQVTKAIPDNLFAHKKLAEIYKELGDPIKAIQRYELVLNLNPLDEDAKINLESLSGAPAADEHEVPGEASAPVESVPEQAFPAPSKPVPAEHEAIPAEPGRAEQKPAPPRSQPGAPVPAQQGPLEAEPAPVQPGPPEPEPVPVEIEPVSDELGGAPLAQTPVEMSSTDDESGSKLEDMLMHEEIKAEATEPSADFQRFSQSFSSDLREKGPVPEKPKDDAPMYYTGEEPGAPQSEEREVPSETHPFARFAGGEGLAAEDNMSAQDLSEETLADIPVVEESEVIPEVSLSEDELEELEAGYPGEIEAGFGAAEEGEVVPEITLSESEVEEAAFPDMPGTFSFPSDNETAAAPEAPVIPDVPAEPVTSFTREAGPLAPDITAEKDLVEPKKAPALEKAAGPGGDPEMLQALKRAEAYIDAGDFVQAVQYYDMLLEKFPGERKILQKLEELKTYLKMTGKGQEIVVRKMEILLEGIRKRKNEFFGSA